MTGISDEHRAELHRLLDQAIEKCGERCSIEVKYQTIDYPDESAGMMRRKQTGGLTIQISPPPGNVQNYWV